MDTVEKTLTPAMRIEIVIGKAMAIEGLCYLTMSFAEPKSPFSEVARDLEGAASITRDRMRGLSGCLEARRQDSCVNLEILADYAETDLAASVTFWRAARFALHRFLPELLDAAEVPAIL